MDIFVTRVQQFTFYGEKRYNFPIQTLGLGRYGHQPYRYVFDTDLADTIRIRYDTHVNDLRFQNQEYWISTTKKKFWIDLFSESFKY